MVLTSTASDLKKNFPLSFNYKDNVPHLCDTVVRVYSNMRVAKPKRNIAHSRLNGTNTAVPFYIGKV